MDEGTLPLVRIDAELPEKDVSKLIGGDLRIKVHVGILKDDTRDLGPVDWHRLEVWLHGDALNFLGRLVGDLRRARHFKVLVDDLLELLDERLDLIVVVEAHAHGQVVVVLIQG